MTLTPLSQALGGLDESSSLPLYQQLQRALRQAIETRLLSPDDALPPERDLATEFAVSRITVRKAIDGLVNEGMLVRRQGSGTFVCARVEKNFSKLTSFSEDMRARGRNPRSVWLRRSAGTVTPEESLTLRSSPGTPVYRFHRIRFADDAPMAIEYATVLASCLPSLDAVESSLYEALEQAGNRPVRALQRLRAVLFTAEQAELLQAKEKDAGLLVERLGFLKDGSAAEFTQSLLSRRHLRFRRRAQCFIVNAPENSTQMYCEAEQAPEVVRQQFAANCRTPRAARRAAAPTLAARGGHLRARQLRSRRHIREVSHRDAAQYSDFLGRARRSPRFTRRLRISRAPCSWRSHSRGRAPTCWLPCARRKMRAPWSSLW